MVTSIERRQHPRIAMGLRATCRVNDGECHGSVLDVAMGGAFIVVETPNELASKVMLRFWFGEEVHEASGLKVRATRTKVGPAVGVRFDERNAAFVEWVEKLARMSQEHREIYLKQVSQVLVFFH